MTQYAIITDLNRCVGCLACTVACKAVNGVDVGAFWIKTLRIGPNLKEDGSGSFPDIEMYFLPVQCQHCADPECVKVCPTEASQKLEDGTVQVDKAKCIGCQFCAMACPYNVRYLNEEERVIEKCTLCEQKIAQGELPQCVAQCGSRARYFGDVEQGVDNFEAPGQPNALSCTYDEMMQTRTTLKEYVDDYTEDEIHYLTDVGNKPQIMYLLRNHYGDRRDRTWRG